MHEEGEEKEGDVEKEVILSFFFVLIVECTRDFSLYLFHLHRSHTPFEVLTQGSSLGGRQGVSSVASVGEEEAGYPCCGGSVRRAASGLAVLHTLADFAPEPRHRLSARHAH